MRRLTLLIWLAASLLLAGCGSEPEQPADRGPETEQPADRGPETEEPTMTTTTLAVDGMTCGNCENAIQTSVGKLPGVQSISASHTEKSVTVTYDSDRVTVPEILEAISALGFTPSPPAD
jgi:Cu+-exporting ATPase